MSHSDPKNSSNNWSARLREAGLKVTPGRVAILSALARYKRPVTVEELMERLGGEVNQATVYRAMGALVEAGVVRSIDLRHGHSHYELAGSDHHHLVCVTCGRLEDFTYCEAEAMSKKILRTSAHFSEVRDHSFELFGVCRACA